MNPLTKLVVAPLLVAAVSILTGARGAQDGAPVIGAKAPALTFQSVDGGSLKDWNLDALKGQVVVVDFTASWCGPCRITFPHYSKLAEELKGKPVRFICVTAEDPAIAKKFRADLKMSMPLATDLDGSTFERYWVSAIPDAAVIDKDGVLVGRLHPSMIKAADLLALAEGKKVTFPTTAGQSARRSWNPKASADAAKGTWLKKVDLRGGRASIDPSTGIISFDGLPASLLLSIAYDHDVQEIELSPADDGKTYYSGRVEAPDKQLATARKILAPILREQLGLEVEFVKRTQSCYVLKKGENLKLEKPTKSDASQNMAMLGQVNFKHATAADMTSFIRRYVDKPVLNETGISEPFSFAMKWDALKGTPELMKQFEAAGFKLELAERPVTWLIARKV